MLLRQRNAPRFCTDLCESSERRVQALMMKRDWLGEALDRGNRFAA
ncbi:hypothetical protein RIEGSTA812A_PEG_1040 [invertebrate metagenome]|uniref:Uncharacterized protein n=1 Tax=invertebrate metagenome TaxID=1711999 RepID=A0A484H642_9ZZZZ